MFRRIKICNLIKVIYAYFSFQLPREILFNFKDIEKAIIENRFDSRNYQINIEKLKNEWNLNSKNIDEYFEKHRRYHIERIVYLIKSGEWKTTISVKSYLKTIIDWLHRVWAAEYLKEQEIEAIVIGK